MAMYRYVKAVPKVRTPRPLAVSYILMTTGLAIIIWTVWPILSFMMYDAVVLAKTITPVAEPEPADIVVSGVAGETTNPNTWFPTKPQKKVSSAANSYLLSIPSLDIKDATVVIAGDDLSKSLIHYGGTADPGDYGNTVIFGHSTLPQFFRGVKDYKSIFATLPTIKPGSDIIITYDGVDYTYSVVDKIVVEPNDLSPLEQRFDDSYLTVVTCVPPGTYLYRLNVKARLKRI